MRKQGLFLLRGISHGRNDADRIFEKVVGAVHEMTGRGDGERSERTDVGTTVRDNFFFKVEHLTAFYFRHVICHERFPIFRIHAVRVVAGGMGPT